jgi:hypothetical protein
MLPSQYGNAERADTAGTATAQAPAVLASQRMLKLERETAFQEWR